MTPFALFLERIRRSRRLQQKQLAVDLGIQASYLSLLEKGRKSPPSKAVLEKLINVLGLNPDEQAELWICVEQSQRTLQLPDHMDVMEYQMINELRKQLGQLTDVQITIILNVLALNSGKTHQVPIRRTTM